MYLQNFDTERVIFLYLHAATVLDLLMILFTAVSDESTLYCTPWIARLLTISICVKFQVS